MIGLFYPNPIDLEMREFGLGIRDFRTKDWKNRMGENRD